MTRNEDIKPRINVLKKKRNKTTLFMLPALNLSAEKTGIELLEHFGFVNCYIEHKDSPFKGEDYVYLVFNPSKNAMKEFYKFFEVYKSYQNFIGDYVVDNNIIVVVFKVKDKWKNTYKEFKSSNYSKMSKEYAELFKRPDLATGKVFTSLEYFIITKHKDYKAHLEKYLDVQIDDSAELMDKLNYELEVFEYERITEFFPREGECEITEAKGDSVHL